MGLFSRFENKMEDAFDSLGDKMHDAPISPVQIAKKCEKQMRRNKMVGAGKQYAPTLYTILVNPNDDARLVGYYPTLAGEMQTYIKAKANESSLDLDGEPLVRFIVDADLKRGKFDVVAETVASPIIEQLREEENEHYGIVAAQNKGPFASPAQQNSDNAPSVAQPNPYIQQAPASYPSVKPSQVPQSYPTPNPSFAVNNQNQTPYNDSFVSHDNKVNKREVKPDNSQIDPRLSAAEPVVFDNNYEATGGQVSKNDTSMLSKSATLRDNSSGKIYNLNTYTNVLGRETTCNIVIPDANASRQHAQILYNNGIWTLNDLGSTNGTYINNIQITTRQLNTGDIITIGMTNLTFNIC